MFVISRVSLYREFFSHYFLKGDKNWFVKSRVCYIRGLLYEEFIVPIYIIFLLVHLVILLKVLLSVNGDWWHKNVRCLSIP